jgi:ArsR family transcriptional regulator
MRVSRYYNIEMSDLIHDTTSANRAATLLKAIGHPLRLRILALLDTGERNVSEICDELDAVQARVSQQLRILRGAELVDVVRAGGHATYRITEPNLHQMLGCVSGCCARRERSSP